MKKKKTNKKKFNINLKDNFKTNYFLMTTIIYIIEILFKILSSNFEFDYSLLRILISTMLITFIVSYLTNILKSKKIKNIINIIFVFLYTFYTWIQLGFYNYIGVYVSFNTSSQFGAVAGYIGDFLESFKLIYHLIWIPLIIYILVHIFILDKEYTKIKLSKKSFLNLIYIFILCLCFYLTLVLPFMQNKYQIKSNLELFSSSSDAGSLTINEFGVIDFAILDLKSYLFPKDEPYSEYNVTVSKESSSVDKEREVKTFSLENVLDSDVSSKYSNINNYFLSQSLEDYNEYTGMFEGKNLIVVLMESANEALINEEYYPNFYELYSNGWSFVNNYSPRNSCATGNNEFSAMTSLYSIHNTCTSNVYENNTYFESIFNLFNNKGYTTNSMHDYYDWYYDRNVIHPNMGSQKFYDADALGIELTKEYGDWPSDEEFFEKVMKIFNEETEDGNYMMWLTTVTSHQPYSSESVYGDLYKDDFMALGYSENVSRYLSKLKVLDNALGIMMNSLKESGKLDDTVIVLLADHYPYGLNNSAISEIIDHDLEDYEIEKTPFVIYNSEVESKTFTQYNSYINLLPTIANLFNLDYDTRLYMGSDVLSDNYESMVVFADGSWKNDLVYYNASSGKLTNYKENNYTTEDIKNINQIINNKMTISTNAIKNNYFSYLNNLIEEYKKQNNNNERCNIPTDKISN